MSPAIAFRGRFIPVSYTHLVINEIEKAHVKMLTGLMEAIDTGYLGMADNTKPINLNQCILFFTSNLPIDMDKYKPVSYTHLDVYKSQVLKSL